MTESDILEVVRTSTTWTEVDERLAEWRACEYWWRRIAWPGLLPLNTLLHATPRERLNLYLRARRRDELAHYLPLT